MGGTTRVVDPEVTEADRDSSTDDTIAGVGEASLRSHPARDDEAVLPETIGRHRVLSLLGRGGMGVVFVAHDPELDRKIAIKLVHRQMQPGREQTTARARMKREAQAMAKLSHPNVITVYDVGEHDSQLYIAMELVEGRSLRTFMRADKRPRVRDVLDIAMQAGRGLAAAHKAGLVHRDFKPDNVMIGDDGLVRVLDFGLAHPADEASTAHDVATLTSGGMELTRVTRTGAMVGTPAYMAPEQLEGKPADARSDQFSFCVAIWEALFGERPFPGDDLASLAFAVTSGELRAPPRDRDVPRGIRRVLRRGLSTDPADRFADMPALLAALSRQRRRRWIVAGGVALFGAGSLLAVFAADLRDDRCTGATAELAGIWDRPRQDEVAAAMRATALPYAETVFSRVEPRMRDWSDRWVAVHTEACEATRIRGERSEAMLDDQMRCLHAARAQAAALVEVLAQADVAAVERAVAAVIGLPAPETCADLDTLSDRVALPDDAQAAAEVGRIRDAIESLQARVATGGDLPAALAEASELSAAADALAFAPLIVEAAQCLGNVQAKVGEYENAVQSLTRAHNLALGLGHDTAARETASALVFVIGAELGRPPDAERWIDAAEAMLQRTHAAPGTEAIVSLNVAAVRQEQGRYEDAEALIRKALQILQDDRAPDDPAIGVALDRLGMVLALRGQLAEAREVFERGLEHAQTQGPDHPAVAHARGNLGVALAKQGDLHAAIEQFEGALATLEITLGPNHPKIASLLSNVGSMRYETGQYEQALAAHERAKEIRIAVLGPEHPDLASTYNNLGNVWQALGEHATALELFDRALALREAAYGAEHPSLASTLGNKGNALMRLQRMDDAIAVYRRALAISEAVHGPEALQVAYALTGLAEAYLRADRPGEAIEPFERALAIRDGKPIDRGLLGATRFGLAEAIMMTGGDRSRAIDLARRAREDYLASQHQPSGELEIIDRFVARHAG